MRCVIYVVFIVIVVKRMKKGRCGRCGTLTPHRTQHNIYGGKQNIILYPVMHGGLSICHSTHYTTYTYRYIDVYSVLRFTIHWCIPHKLGDNTFYALE